MIAPVAAPHAAPWPTGVSQGVSVRQIKAMADPTVGIFVPIMRYFTPLNRAAREMLRERSQHSLCLAKRMLGVHKNFVYFYVNDQPAMCHFRAVVLFMRRIWTADNTGWISRISLGRGVSPSLHRIFFISLCFGDRLSFSRLLFLPFTRYAAYARVGTVPALLRVSSRAEYKKPT